VRACFGHAGSWKSECAVDSEYAHAEPRVAGHGFDGDKPAHFLDDAVHEVQPSPEPSPTPLVVKNGSKIRDWISGGIPGHYRDLKRPHTRFRGRSDEELSVVFMASAALSMRFVQT